MGILDSLTAGLDPSSADWMGPLTDTLYALGILFWTLLGVGVVVVFYFFMTFNIPTHIYEVIGKEQVLRFLRKTRSRIKTKDNVSKLKIWGIKPDFEPPQSEHYMLGRKGKLLNMLKDGTDFRPFTMTSNPGNIVVQDHDIRFWTSQRQGDVVEKYLDQSFFQKYGHYMAFIFGMLILGWMFYVQLKFIQGNLAETTSAASKLAEAMRGTLGGP